MEINHMQRMIGTLRPLDNCPDITFDTSDLTQVIKKNYRSVRAGPDKAIVFYIFRSKVLTMKLPGELIDNITIVGA